MSYNEVLKKAGYSKENIEFIEGQLFVDGMVYHIENTNKKPIGNMNLNLLKGIYSMVYQYVEMLDIEPTGNEISIESREIEKYLGIRLTGKNAYEIKDKLSEYRDYFGFFSKKEFYKILDFSGMKDNKFFLNVGFFLALIRKNNESKNKKKIENFNFNNVLLKTEILK